MLFLSGWTIAGLRQENLRSGCLPSATRPREVHAGWHPCLCEIQASRAGASLVCALYLTGSVRVYHKSATGICHMAKKLKQGLCINLEE